MQIKMKIRGIFAAAIMAVAAVVGCQPVEQLGLPDVTLGATDLEFTQEAGSQEMKFTATREWKAEYDADWIAVTPASGQGSNDEQSVTVTVTENTKGNRTAKVTITIGMVSKAFNVNQAGPEGETDGVEALTVKEFIEKADTENYYRLTGTVSGFNATYCSFDITDETGKIYVYSVTDESKAEWTDKIRNGGTVVLQGKYLYYEQKSQHEVVDAIIESFTEGAQSGPEEPVNAIYFNDFDKETSAKVNDKWPYCDEFDGWKNEKGSGVANVTYTFKSASPRATSGNNNIWLPKTGAYLAVQDIALGEATSLELSFNVICGSPGNYKKEFSSSAFKVWLSTDKAKWVELPVSVTANGTEFDDAAASFSVPASTSALSIAFEKIADDVDGYRIDNVNLSSSATAGATVDFTDGVAKDFGSGSVDSGGDNGNASVPESKGKKTIEEFITAADEANYYELTGTVSGFNSKYCSFDLSDASGKIYVYSVLADSKSQWSSKIADGGTVTIYGKYMFYELKSQHEVVDAYIVSYTPGEGGDEGGNDGGDDGNTGGITGARYVKVTAEQDDWSGNYLIVYGNNAHAELLDGKKDLNPVAEGLTITNGEIASDATTDAAAVTVAKNGEFYSILLPSGKYLGAQHNGCKIFDEPFDWTIEYSAEGMKISGEAVNKDATNTYYMYCNSNGGNYYRCYVWKDGQSGYVLPELYKYTAE